MASATWQARLATWIFVAFFLTIGAGVYWWASGKYQTEASVSMNAPLESPLSQSLQGYWKLDDGTGTNATDSSGNANTLAMTGSPSWVTGNIGPYALDFSGSGQYLSVADPSSGVLDMADGASFTITGWFNRDTFAADHTVVAKKNDQTTNQGYIVWIDNNASTDYLNFEISDGTDTYSVAGSTDLSATGWHHFAAVWNNSVGMFLYLDGGLNGSTTTSTSSIGDLSNALAFRIGAESDAGNPFDGKIDDVRVYGSALSADQVLKLSQTTAPAQPVDTGLVGYWTFDGPDIQGTTAMDRSGKGNNGTATGTTKTIGKLGQGLQFNGTGDYISLPANPFGAFNPRTATKTVTAWVKFNSLSGYNVFNAETVGEYSFGFYSSTDMAFYDGTIWTVPHNASVNTWYFFAWVLSGGYFYAYKDGTYIGRDGPLTNNTMDPNDKYIGKDLNGVLDDVRMYNRALSATEILSLYNQGK